MFIEMDVMMPLHSDALSSVCLTMIIMMVFSFYAAIIMAFAIFFRSFWFRVSIWVPLLPCLAMHIIIALDASTNIIPETRHGNTISIWLLHRWSGSIFVCEYGDKHSVSFMWFFFAMHNHYIALLQIHDARVYKMKQKI